VTQCNKLLCPLRYKNVPEKAQIKLLRYNDTQGNVRNRQVYMQSDLGFGFSG